MQFDTCNTKESSVTPESVTPESVTPESTKTESWTSKISDYVTNIRDECILKQIQHEACGHHYRNLELILTLPLILIPSLSGPLVLLLASITKDNCDTITTTDYFATFALILTSIFSNLISFFKFGTRSTKHFMYSSKYSDICTDIEAEIVKAKKYRLNATVFITTIKMKFDNMVFGEPVIPVNIIHRTIH